MTRSTWWSALAHSTKVTTRPVLQIAADGCWERARVVEAADLSTTGPTAVREVASAARRDVAVDVLWPGQAFVGVRWPAAQADEAAAAASRTDGVLSRQGGDAAPPIIEAALVALLGATPSPDLERAELGAVNAWASVGPEVLWRNGDAWTPQDLDALVAGRPDLCVCARPVAVELAVRRRSARRPSGASCSRPNSAVPASEPASSSGRPLRRKAHPLPGLREAAFVAEAFVEPV